jgi:hypothetical protein
MLGEPDRTLNTPRGAEDPEEANRPGETPRDLFPLPLGVEDLGKIDQRTSEVRGCRNGLESPQPFTQLLRRLGTVTLGEGNLAQDPFGQADGPRRAGLLAELASAHRQIARMIDVSTA